MNQKEKIISETVKPAERTSDISIKKIFRKYIKPKQGETPDPDVERTERQTEGFVDLDPEILAFLREHIDINIYPPKMELKKIRDFTKTLSPELQSSARRTLINKFKEKLAETRTRAAKAQVEIENLVRNNPDISKKELISRLNRIIYSNHLDSQGLEFNLAVEKFLDARDKVQSTVERYRHEFGERWQEEIFRDLFGDLPKSKIDIEVLPANIYIRIFDIRDYVFAYMYALGDTEKKSARNSGGAKLNSEFENLPQLNGKILIENSAITPPVYSPRTKSHEEEHAIFEYYDPRLSQNPSLEKVLDTYINSTRGEIEYNSFKDLTDRWALNWVLAFESSAKDEVLAYLKGGEDIHSILGSLEDDNGLYNYLQYYIEEFQQKITAWVRINKIVIKNKSITEDEINALARDALSAGWQKYKKDINAALEAVAKLLQRYQKSPDDRLKIIRLLSQEPLNKWRRLEKILS